MALDWLPKDVIVKIVFKLKRHIIYEDLIVRLKNYIDVTIKKGFYTDFGSVPRVLWSIFAPWDRQCLIAFIVHDYLYYTGEKTRLRADKVLLVLMKHYGASWFKRHAIYRGVRTGGWVAWNEHRRREQEKKNV